MHQQRTPSPPQAPPLPVDFFSRITGRLSRNPGSVKGTVNVCSTRDSPEGQQLSPKEVAEEIMRQFEYCLPHSHGESELHNVAFCGDVLRLRLLLEHIDSHPGKLSTLNQRNRLGCTPVRLAATGGHESCLNLLVKAGADIHVVDVKGQTPLFVAVKNRRLGCAKLLLQSGAHPDGDPKNSSTPLYVAFMNGDIQFVLLLLQYGAHPDKLRHLAPGSTLLFQGGFAPKISTLDAAMEHLHEGDVYTAVRALLERGCRTYTVHYHSCVYMDRGKLIDLLHAYGIRSDWRDENGRLATELNVKNDAKQRLMFHREHPRSLLSACRVTIISRLQRPRKGLDCLDLLPLPFPLIGYLKFPDV